MPPSIRARLILIGIAALVVAIAGEAIGLWEGQIPMTTYLALAVGVGALLVELHLSSRAESLDPGQHDARRTTQTVLIDLLPPMVGVLFGVALLFLGWGPALLIAGPVATLALALGLRWSRNLSADSIYRTRFGAGAVACAVLIALLPIAAMAVVQGKVLTR